MTIHLPSFSRDREHSTSTTLHDVSPHDVERSIGPDDPNYNHRGNDLLDNEHDVDRIKSKEFSASFLHEDGSKITRPLSRHITQEEIEAEEVYFPEGGLRAWLCVGGSFCITFITFGYLNSFGVFQEYLGSSGGPLADYNDSTIAWIVGVQYFLIFGCGSFAGRLFDLGYWRPLFTFGAVVLVVSQMLLSLCTEYYQIFLAQGVGLGLGFGATFNIAVSCPAHHFNRRRGLAMGIVATGSSVGGTIFPIMIGRLIPQIGYGWTMRAVGFMALAMCTIASFCLSTRFEPSIDVHDKSKGGWKQVRWVDLTAFKNPAYTWFCAATATAMFGMYTPFTYTDIFTTAYDVPAHGYFISILNASSCFGRILPGLIGDKFGRINTLLPNMAISGILLLIYPLCTNLGGLLTFAILYGFTSGCFISITTPCVAQLGKSTATVGTRIGMMFFFMSIGGLVGTPITGAILGDSYNYNWWGAFGYSGATVLAGSGMVVMSRRAALNNRWVGKI